MSPLQNVSCGETMYADYQPTLRLHRPRATLYSFSLRALLLEFDQSSILMCTLTANCVP